MRGAFSGAKNAPKDSAICFSHESIASKAMSYGETTMIRNGWFVLNACTPTMIFCAFLESAEGASRSSSVFSADSAVSFFMTASSAMSPKESCTSSRAADKVSESFSPSPSEMGICLFAAIKPCAEAVTGGSLRERNTKERAPMPEITKSAAIPMTIVGTQFFFPGVLCSGS